MPTNQLKKKFTENNIIGFFVILSMLICAWIQYIQYGRINIDSVLYFESAKLIANGDFLGGMKIYNWPFYSSCIALTHNLTDLNIEHSAKLLNVIFFGITTASYLKVITLAGGKNLEIIFGALILLSTRHIVGEMLSMQMRDEGFWAFFLLSLVFFIKFFEYGRFIDSILWQTAIIIAMLFRVEALGYLLLLPMVIFFTSYPHQKWQGVLINYTLPFILFVAYFTSIMLIQSTSILSVSRLQEIQPSIFLHDLTAQLQLKSQIFANDILGKYLGDYAIESLLTTFLLIIFIKSINTIGFVNLGLVAITIVNSKELIKRSVYKILIATCIISVLNLMFIVTRSFVIVGRYTAAVTLILLILASFSIRWIIESKNKYIIIRYLAFTFLTIFITINIWKNVRYELDSQYYLKDAALWLKNKNTEQYPVLYDSILTRYFSGEPYLVEYRLTNKIELISEKINSNAFENYKYIILDFNNNSENIKKTEFMAKHLPNYKSIKRFNSTKDKHYAIVYKRN